MCNELSVKGEGYIIGSIVNMELEMSSRAAEPYVS